MGARAAKRARPRAIAGPAGLCHGRREVADAAQARKRQACLALLVAAAVVFALLLPSFYIIYISFNEYGFGARVYEFTFDWYRVVLGDTMLVASLKWTAYLAIATVIEVCSEGSAPIAFELYRQIGALGNPFVFLMAGVATDYTEIGLLWSNIGRRTALWLPAVVVPQVLLLAWLMNRS